MTFAMRTFLYFTTMIALLCSCSTISKRQTAPYPLPPQSPLDQATTEPARLLNLYQQAKLWAPSDAAKSCALWDEVLAAPKFPLAHIARLRAMEVCGADHVGFAPIEQVLATTHEPWLDDLLIRSSLVRAEKTGQKIWEMNLSLREAGLEKLQGEKLRRLERARMLANELQNADVDAAAKIQIETFAPRFIEHPKTDELLKVAADFKQARQFEKAREVYSQVIQSEDLTALEKLKALEGIRHSYKLEKKTENYLQASKSVANFAEKEFLKRGLLLNKNSQTAEQSRALLTKYFDTRLSFARAIWTEGSPAEAEKVLRKAEDDVHGTIPIDESIFIRAAIEEEAGHLGKSVELLKQINTDRVGNHDLRTKILWARAWDLRKLGRLKKALVVFKDMLAKDETSTRARFWLAKTEKDLGLTQPSIADFEALIATDKMSWYALLSYRELGREMPTLANAPAKVPETESAFLPGERLTLAWLLAAGEDELARKFLDQIASERKASESENQTLDLLTAYAHSGHYQALFARLNELPTEKRVAVLEKDPTLLFPQPWAPLVQSASEKFGVQSELIYAIMRQESSFDPLARSGADAFGLLQLIPEMAKRAEVTAHLPLASNDDLYEPEINIPLGAAFLHDLFLRWNGHFILSVASYNASDKAVARWLKSRYRGDVLTFIEDVPYEETRTYIKLVMRNFIFYQRLNSRGAPVAFPEWCLANLQDAKP